jgi:large subunit ribosomal protein L24e
MDCNFCGTGIPRGTEFIYVNSKGKAHYFCSGKCYKNLIKLNRKPRAVKWTKAYADEKEARLKLLGHKAVDAPAATPEEKPKIAAKEAPAPKAEKTEKKAEARKKAAAPAKKEDKKGKKPAKK